MEILVDDYKFIIRQGSPGLSASIQIETIVGPVSPKDEPELDIISSMILAHYCAGVHVGSDAYKKGLQTTIDAIVNANLS